MTEKKEKNIGIELLRILSMLMVLTLHILGQGGVCGYTAMPSVMREYPLNYPIAWIFEVAAFGAVDLFGLISGYVGVKAHYATKKYVRLWLLVAFWGVAMVFLVDCVPGVFTWFNEHILGPVLGTAVNSEFPEVAVEKSMYLDAALPVLKNQYWYFSAYTVCFFLSPVLNAVIRKLPKKVLLFVCIGLAVLLSVIPTAANRDIFGTGNGSSAIWLIVLYLFGAYIRLYTEEEPPEKKKRVLRNALYILIFVAAVAAAWGYHMYIKEQMSLYPKDNTLNGLVNQFIHNTSPSVLISAIALLLLFRQIRVKSEPAKKAVLFFSGAAFAVYIIHVQGRVWRFFMANRFKGIAYEPTGRMVLLLIASVLILFVVCVLLERLRLLLFKGLYIEKLVDKGCNAFDGLWKKLFEKVRPHIMVVFGRVREKAPKWANGLKRRKTIEKPENVE